MEKAFGCVKLLVFFYFLFSCSSVRQVEQLPVDIYSVPAALFPNRGVDSKSKPERVKATLELVDSTLLITPSNAELPTLSLHFHEPRNFRIYRRTFDVDVLTIPFKIRPSIQGFPEQLNPNFSAALYLGRRIDSYHIKPQRNSKKRNIISSFGGGYGGFLGIGSVTMNPFVTQNAITYEYEGFVLTGGAAAIYDAKKFNLGLALGIDFLVDKNRKSWIYHKKPWFGILFGINLN